MSMELIGTCVQVLPIESGHSKSGGMWEKRNFVVKTEEQYPRKVCFQLFGDKIKLCPNEGEAVRVFFDAESNEWKGRWYTNLSAWRVERGWAAQPLDRADYSQLASTPAEVAAPAEASDDGLPF